MRRPANRVVADFMGLVNLVPAKVVAARNGIGTLEAAGGLTRRGPAARRHQDRRQRRGRDPPRKHPPQRGRQRRARHHQRPHLPRQHQRVLRQPRLRSDASGTDPSGAGLRGRRHGRDRDRHHAMQRVSRIKSIGVSHERRQRHRRDQGPGALDQEGRRQAVPVGEARAGRARRTAPCCSCTARRWRRSRPSICTCRAGRTRRRWTISPSAASTPGAIDMEGYGRSTKDRGIDATISEGADDLEGRHRLHLQDPQPHRAAAGLRHLVGRAARRAVRAAPSQPRASGSRSTPMSGPAKAARRWPSAARSCRNSSRPSGGRSTASSSARSSSATIPAPPTTT